jgi:hypothetical protein
MDDKAMFETLVREWEVDVRYKDESAFMRLCGKLAFFTPEFMSSITTTMGATVYFPSRAWVEEDYGRAWRVLCHELVHVEDYRALGKNGWLFGVGYAMPQGLAVLALLGIPFHSWWFLLFLLLLAPLPAPWRKAAEMRGYAMTMAVRYWTFGGGIPKELKDHIVQNFVGPKYYFMWPFKGAVEREVGQWSRMTLCDEIQRVDPVYAEVHSVIKSRQAAKP